MYIFIDESGIFAPTGNKSQWSTVGAVCIPDTAQTNIEKSLKELKEAHRVEGNDEFKRNRPDSSSYAYQLFLKDLRKYACILHVMSHSGKMSDLGALENHRKDTINAIIKFINDNGYTQTTTGALIPQLQELSPQEYNQLVIQSEMICRLLRKIIIFYAENAPSSIGAFKWIFDRKDDKMNNYEKVFSILLLGLVEVSFARTPVKLIANENRNYSFFAKSNICSIKNNIDATSKETQRRTGYDLNSQKRYLNLFNISTLFKEMSFEDSKSSYGLQTADLLISSVNRCLKANFSENGMMAVFLGRLMLDSISRDETAISFLSLQSKVPIEIDKYAMFMAKIMNKKSHKLVSRKFDK